jgi:hypothetical protein
MRDDITHLRSRSEEMPIMLANSQVGPRGRLFNPTAIANGWAPMLVAPNPKTRDELVQFTGELRLQVEFHFKFFTGNIFISCLHQFNNVWLLQRI